MKYTLPESNDHAWQHQNILFERSLASKLSNTPKMIFISHLQPLQISNKAKVHAFFEKFSRWKLKPAPTQDKFLDLVQNEFSHSKYFQMACLITWMLNFFQIKYFDVTKHDHLILEVYTSLVNVKGIVVKRLREKQEAAYTSSLFIWKSIKSMRTWSELFHFCLIFFVRYKIHLRWVVSNPALKTEFEGTRDPVFL